MVPRFVMHAHVVVERIPIPERQLIHESQKVRIPPGCNSDACFRLMHERTHAELTSFAYAWMEATFPYADSADLRGGNKQQKGKSIR